ncbi:MAG: hypothetical protein GC160_29705 [Acidobacteria bacterium]|nr:hypothetical protein [Acidobacteriota bacterium]
MDAKLSACQGKATALLAGVFLAGVLSGGVGMRVWDRTQQADAVIDPIRAESALALERLSNELALNPEQVQQVQIILDEYIMLEADLMSQMRARQQQGRAEILKVLDQQQRSKFEGMFQPVSD